MRTLIGFLLLLAGCTQCDRFLNGHDWIVVQYDFRGAPSACWVLPDTVLHRDGQTMSWVEHGQMVYITGSYRYAMVNDDRYDQAAALLGVETDRCRDGRYLDVWKEDRDGAH